MTLEEGAGYSPWYTTSMGGMEKITPPQEATKADIEGVMLSKFWPGSDYKNYPSGLRKPVWSQGDQLKTDSNPLWVYQWLFVDADNHNFSTELPYYNAL